MKIFRRKDLIKNIHKILSKNLPKKFAKIYPRMRSHYSWVTNNEISSWNISSFFTWNVTVFAWVDHLLLHIEKVDFLWETFTFFYLEFCGCIFRLKNQLFLYRIKDDFVGIFLKVKLWKNSYTLQIKKIRITREN